MKKRVLFFVALLLAIVAAVYLLESVLPSLEQQYNIPKNITLLLNKVFIALLLITFAFVLTYLVEGFLRGAFYAISEENIRTITNVVRYSLIAITTILVIFVFIADFSAFTLFSGLIGAGLAIALQQPILSITGWLVIISSRPYRIGHRIAVDDVRGDVINIRLFFTDLVEFGGPGKETETGRLIHMSNSMVIQKAIVNYTSDSPYLWDEVAVSITYESDLKLAKKLMEDIATEIVGEKMKNAVRFLYESREYRLKFRDTHTAPHIYAVFAPSWLDLSVRYLVEARNARAIHTHITEAIFEAFRKSKKVEIAYPHVEVVRK